MRGTHGRQGPSGIEHRIIPADAGNTGYVLVDIPYDAGSSPRMRGTLASFTVESF